MSYSIALTPEERAEQVWDIIGAHPDDPTNDQDYSTIIGVIAAAMRAAEAEVLERAIELAMKHRENERSEFGAGANATAESIISGLRELKGEVRLPA